MEAMIILRGYGEPQKLLARTLLIRSPKRKSIWMFQTVINSIFQQCEKETLSDLAAEESAPGELCLAQQPALGAKDTMGTRGDPQQCWQRWQGRLCLQELLSCCPPHCARQHSKLLTGSFTGASTQPGVTTFFKMSIFSPLYSLKKKILLGQVCLKPNFGLNATVCRSVSTKFLRVFVWILFFFKVKYIMAN